MNDIEETRKAIRQHEEVIHAWMRPPKPSPWQQIADEIGVAPACITILFGVLIGFGIGAIVGIWLGWTS